MKSHFFAENFRKSPKIVIGPNFATWAIFFDVGRNFYYQLSPNDLGALKTPKISYISSTF
jgi:hypothetical protein